MPYIRDDIDRLYLSRKGETGLTSFKDAVDASIRRLEDYTKKRKQRLISMNRNQTKNTMITWKVSPRKQKWEEKQLFQAELHTRRLEHG